MKKLLALALLLSSVSYMISCTDEKTDPVVNLAAPSVTAPSAQSAQVGTTIELSFPYTAAAGFKSSSVSATGGSATVTTDGTLDATSGTITVSFAAGTSAGAGSVTLSITDGEDDTDDATAVISISTSAVPAISGIPATAELRKGAVLEVTGVALTAADGFASFSVTVDGGSAVDLASLITVGGTSATVTISYPTADLAEGNHTFVFSLSDTDGDVATFTHILTVFTLPNGVLSGVISQNTTLTNDRIWELAGRVIVQDGVTITIEEGTIVKGREGAASLASALVIARGAKIMAEGTANAPIIFTSILDNIKLGEKVGTNLTKLDNAKWGGLIILGKAKISATNGDTEALIEGLPADEAYGVYGGDVDDDNSGVLKYVSIRHGGALIGEGNEINGLTLGGVGNGTTIDNLEIFATLDDGVELFGGTVNITNLVVYFQGDDGVDIDQNYNGTISNFFVFQGEGVGTDEGTEIDGPENSTYKTGTFKLVNGTFTQVGDCSTCSAADLKSKPQGSITNCKWVGYTSADLKIEHRVNATSCVDDRAGEAYDNLLSGALTITGSSFTKVKVYMNPSSCTLASADQDAAAAKVTIDATATGATDSGFEWTVWKSLN